MQRFASKLTLRRNNLLSEMPLARDSLVGELALARYRAVGQLALAHDGAVSEAPLAGQGAVRELSLAGQELVGQLLRASPESGRVSQRIQVREPDWRHRKVRPEGLGPPVATTQGFGYHLAPLTRLVLAFAHLVLAFAQPLLAAMCGSEQLLLDFLGKRPGINHHQSLLA